MTTEQQLQKIKEKLSAMTAGHVTFVHVSDVYAVTEMISDLEKMMMAQSEKTLK